MKTKSRATIEKMLSSRKEKAAERLHAEFERGRQMGRREIEAEAKAALQGLRMDSIKSKAHAMEALAKVAKGCGAVATAIAQMAIDGRME